MSEGDYQIAEARVQEVMDEHRRFTQGPWRTQGWTPMGHYIVVKDARHNNVCVMYPDPAHKYTRDEVAANAALVAAATELYEALERCEQMVSAAAGPPDWDWVRSVLKKARGKS